ncbi:hypothetical protein F4680DRAFT_408602 [Xylaria scruposa]|nr:hypothetical protein F4680DRAFT_408602 [Xylaria scruposa]
MAAPFGFSVGDFITVGKLIGVLIAELRKNGEAAPEYQSLLIELEALDRALRQLQALTPANHELIQLTSIRATALACRRPLQDFLGRISKFESCLGSSSAANNKWNGLHRRMQFRIMFKEDVEHLRSTLASHVATINLLLMTQAVTSISAAEEDRGRVISNLEGKILENRRLLKDVGRRVDESLGRRDIKAKLKDQDSILDKLGKAADETRGQLSSQGDLIQDIRVITTHIQEETNTTLATVTEVLALVTSGLVHLRHITRHLHTMIRVCVTFTADMRKAMSKLMELFFSIQTTLQRIDQKLPIHIRLPIVLFTTALGETMALPYQLCQQWATFKELLGVIFLDKPGKSRVDMGKYLIMNVQGGRLLGENSWQHAVKQDDHLTMSIILDEFSAKAGTCQFPACRASIKGAEVENGSYRCRKCNRWSSHTRLDILSSSHSFGRTKFEGTGIPSHENNTYTSTGSESSFKLGNSIEQKARLIDDREDIELYRQIYVPYESDDGLGTRIVLQYLHLDLPAGLQVAFGGVVQMMADECGRELRPIEITRLFEQTYFLHANPRFSLVDYSIAVDRSSSPAPPIPGKSPYLKRTFEGVIAVDGDEHRILGRGDGPILSFINALRQVGVDMDLNDYVGHAIGRGRDIKSVSYIECTAGGSNQKVWGVGIHEDLVQSLLCAVLSAASNVSSQLAM